MQECDFHTLKDLAMAELHDVVPKWPWQSCPCSSRICLMKEIAAVKWLKKEVYFNVYKNDIKVHTLIVEVYDSFVSLRTKPLWHVSWSFQSHLNTHELISEMTFSSTFHDYITNFRKYYTVTNLVFHIIS